MINECNDFAVSIISYMEVLGYNFQNKIEQDMVNEMLSLMKIIYVDENIANTVIKLRKTKKIKLPDAIVAGMAIANKIKLVTANIDDFKNVDKLKIVKI